MTTQIKGNDTSTFGGNVDVTGNVITDAPAFRAGSNATQAISVNTWTKVIFGAEFTDTNNNFASSRFTPTVAGYYFITSRVGEGYTGSSGQPLYMAIYKNGGLELRNQSISPTAWYENVGISGLVYCNGSTDYIEIYFYTSASGYTKSAAASNNYFQGFLARAV